ncbi:MAG: dihydroorotate dehydrogenase [Gemmatimonadetes bacterium]|nr:dihydroorotate dehydrogenase [Gemmatimonadota bacterium]MYB71059.1 dihydroorotate dehydrogenase [Gemmatimonadota bacterium]
MGQHMADLSIDFAGVQLRNPVLLASGTCNYGQELLPLTDFARLGGLVTKTITPQPRGGNPPQRIVETPAGMLNSIGLQNPGLAAFVEKQWPLLAGLDAQVVVNIAGFAVEEFGQMAASLEALEGIAALEVNISCPNVEAGGDNFATRPQTAAAAIDAVRSRTQRPVIAKLTPNVTDIAEIARAVVDVGADAVSLINTLVGMAIDVERRRPVLGGTTGGLSGPAIKPVALAMVWKVAQAVAVPVMGIGGITTASDVLEFMVAGASAVQVGTASFANPNAGVEIVEDLHAYCDERGIDRLASLVGSLRC